MTQTTAYEHVITDYESMALIKGMSIKVVNLMLEQATTFGPALFTFDNDLFR